LLEQVEDILTGGGTFWFKSNQNVSFVFPLLAEGGRVGRFVEGPEGEVGEVITAANHPTEIQSEVLLAPRLKKNQNETNQTNNPNCGIRCAFY
jgi:hypothetical protein